MLSLGPLQMRLDAPFRFTRAQYHRMAETGILPHDARVELLDGEIVPMGPIGPNHQGSSNYLAEIFGERLKKRATVSSGGPVVLNENSEPQPDIQILKFRSDRYRSAHPTPADGLLLIEISETSISKDRGRKLALYAQAGIREYWILDLARKVVIVHRGPTGDEYAQISTHAVGSSVSPEAFADCLIPVSDLVG